MLGSFGFLIMLHFIKLKLGLSMAQLGQKDQACTFIASVGNEFPNAVETKKRAQSELKRTGC